MFRLFNIVKPWECGLAMFIGGAAAVVERLLHVPEYSVILLILFALGLLAVGVTSGYIPTGKSSSS